MKKLLIFPVLMIGLLYGALSAGPQPNLLVSNILLENINSARRSAGLPEFIGQPELNQAASKHTEEMLRLNYFGSKSPVPERETLGKRVALEGLSPERLVQKLFQCQDMPENEITNFCMKSWLEKANFKKRLLSSDYTHLGFGVVNENGLWTMTLVFAGGQLTMDNSNAPVEAGNPGCKVLARRIWKLSNEVRAEHSLAPLAEHSILDIAAEGQSEEMLRLKYFSHTSPTPGREKLRQRILLAGADPVRVAENLYQCTGYPPEKVPRMAILAWLNSPGHRANLLHKHHNEVGIGVAVKGNQVYATQVFGGDN